ncbi:MAG: hypothetical protein WBP93_11375 [Pyrinomonadaceae bacterium]
MSHNFAEIVEEIKQLSTEEKAELQNLIESYLIEERRREIHENYQESLNESDENRLDFSSNVDELREILSHD